MMLKRCGIMFLFSLVWFLSAGGQGVIPHPQHLIARQGHFKWNGKTQVLTNLEGEDFNTLQRYFEQVFQQPIYNKVEKPAKNVVFLQCTGTKEEYQKAHSVASLQGYSLEITPQTIHVKAPTPTGLFYALQTILQLRHKNKLACATIQDIPRFSYRGLMLDCVRHFWSKEFILKQIDALSSFKINRLHLHLTDAEGWRLEMKNYPELTQKTAFRPYSSWMEWREKGGSLYCDAQTEGAYGGCYTQDDMREIVRYAADRHIIIIPEIEMPGHSGEVLYAFPHLSCTGEAKGQTDLCIGNEETYTFLENVLKEVMDIFPSEYIHIGGDEARRKAWETCPKCQKVMQENQLKNTAELQAHFTHRIEVFLNEHGRRLLGWDEIMEGKLAPNATVMSWRGEKGGIAAAEAGHDVVMTPGKYCYIDKYQDAPLSQPKAQGGYVTLKKVYSYDPIPAQLVGTKGAKHIQGVQANLWTEYVETPEHAEYMIYPRALAIAEVGWSDHKTSYDNFRKRVIRTTRYMKKQGYHPFDITREQGDRKETRELTRHDGLSKKVTYYSDYPQSYVAQGDETFTNGIRGNWDFADGNWQGLIKKRGVDVMIDLEKETIIRNLSVDFLHSAAVQIYAPVKIEVKVSDDGEHLTTIDTLSIPINRQDEYFIYPYRWKGRAKGRYLYFKALPRQEAGWLFTDEIIINKRK